MSVIRDIMYFVIVLLHVCSATMQTNVNEYIQNDDHSDRTCSGSDLLFTVNQCNKIKCSLFCESENPCSGYTFRSTDGKCSGCQNGAGSLTAVEAGMEYFVPRTRKWGSDCSIDHACSDENQQCMDGVCVCTPGYSFQTTTWSCVAGCSPYGETFQKYVGYRIESNNYFQKTKVSLLYCANQCRTNPDCVSFDFSYSHAGNTICNLSKVSALDKPAQYRAVSNFEYHQRNC